MFSFETIKFDGAIALPKVTTLMSVQNRSKLLTNVTKSSACIQNQMSRRLADQNVASDTSLTFGETRVTGSDIRILNNASSWLTETLIAFYFEFLNSRVFTSYKCSICVPPEVSQIGYYIINVFSGFKTSDFLKLRLMSEWTKLTDSSR